MSNIDSRKIIISQPNLPDLGEFTGMLKDIWDNRILTNSGPYHQALEAALCAHLGVEHLSLYSNGTLALLAALKLLDIQGEVITTPYSFAATSNVLLWQNLTPVFVDVDPQTFNLDPNKITQAITANTTAILPVHCYGIPCDVENIASIAKTHRLRVIYDAAHAFGVKDSQRESILKQGDLSVISFHATKIFNTFEGGAIICPDAETKARADRFKNFGISSETTISEIGINAKLSEIHAALGLLQLKHVDEEIASRRKIALRYVAGLSDVPGLILPNEHYFKSTNFNYFPLMVGAEFTISRDKLYERFKSHNIFARRYFYPLISQFAPYVNLPSSNPKKLPVAHKLSEAVVCLPIHSQLTDSDVDTIISIITEVKKSFIELNRFALRS